MHSPSSSSPNSGPTRSDGRHTAAPEGWDREHEQDDEDDLWVELPGHNAAAVSQLSAYERSLARYQQVSEQEQAQLAELAQTGTRAALRLQQQPPPNTRERHRLERQVSEGQAAGDALTGSVYRLMVAICHEQATKRYGPSRAYEEMPELIAEASLALAEAIGSFSTTHQVPFAKFAGHKMRNALRQRLVRDESRPSVPAAWIRLHRIVKTRMPELVQELGRHPTRAELQADLTLTAEQWAYSKLTPAQRQLPAEQQRELAHGKLLKQGTLGAIERIDEVMASQQATYSLDRPLSTEDSGTFADLLSAPDTPAHMSSELFDAVELDDLRTRIAALLEGLDERPRQMLMYRYGFIDGQEYSFRQLGAMFGLSSERVRQIESESMAYLAGDSQMARSLIGFLPHTETTRRGSR